MHLLDINVLIAITDPQHIHHAKSRGWFKNNKHLGWATCPIVENGYIRILGSQAYEGFTGGTEDAREALQTLTSQPGYQFWNDSISLCDINLFPTVQVSKKLTDQYLLSLAVSNGGKLVTLDKRISTSSVPQGDAAYVLI